MRECVCALAIAPSGRCPVAGVVADARARRRQPNHAAQQLVARTAARWQHIWHERAESSSTAEVDFLRDMVNRPVWRQRRAGRVD